MNPFEQIMQMMRGSGGISPVGSPSPMPSRPPMTLGGLPGAAPQPGMSTPSLNLGAEAGPLGASLYGAGQDAMHSLGGLAPNGMGQEMSQMGGDLMGALGDILPQGAQAQYGSPPLGSGGAPQLPGMPNIPEGMGRAVPGMSPNRSRLPAGLAGASGAWTDLISGRSQNDPDRGQAQGYQGGQMDPSMAGALESGIKALGRLGQTPTDGGWDGSLPPLYQETDAQGAAVPGGESYGVGDALKSAMGYVNPFAEASPDSRAETVDAVRQQLEAIRSSAKGSAGQAAELAKKYRNQARQAKDPNRTTSAAPVPREGRGRGVLLPATNDKLEPVMAGQKTDSRAIDTRKSRFGASQGSEFAERAHGVGGTKPSGDEEDSFLEDALMLPLRLPMYLRNFLQNTVGSAIHGGVSPQQRKLELQAEDQTQQYYQSIVSREFQLRKMENEMGTERFRKDILPMLGGLDQQIMNRKGGPDAATGRVGQAFIDGLEEKEPGAFESLFMANEETAQGIASDAQKIANRTGLIDAKTQALLDVVKDKDKYTSEQLSLKIKSVEAEFAQDVALSKMANRDSRTGYNRAATARMVRGGSASGGSGGDGDEGYAPNEVRSRAKEDNARTQTALDILDDDELGDDAMIARLKSLGQEAVMSPGMLWGENFDADATRDAIAARSHPQFGPGGGAAAPPRMIGDRLEGDMKNQPDLRQVASFMSITYGGTEEENLERLRKADPAKRARAIEKFKARGEPAS